MASTVQGKYKYDLESKMHEREDHSAIKNFKIYDFVNEEGTSAMGNVTRDRNSQFKDAHFKPRLDGTQLRWFVLRNTNDETFSELKEQCYNIPDDNLDKNLLRNSIPKFRKGHRFAQDYMEYFSTFRVPTKEESGKTPSDLDAQLGIYFPYFQYYDSTSNKAPIYPRLVQYSHSFNEPWPKSAHGSLPIVVQQMWLFVIDSQTVISYFPDESENNAHHNETLFKAILKRGSPHGSRRRAILDRIEDAYLMAANMVRRAAFLNIRGWLVTDSILPKVEQKVGDLTKKRNEAYGVLLHGMKRSSAPSETSRISETHLLLEAMAFVEELTSFVHIVECQMDIVKRMADFLSHENDTQEPAKELYMTLGDLEELRASINRAVANATQIQASVLQLLDLRQKNEAAQQGRTILVFTLFTVIFLPISFFTSYFGMNVRSFIGSGGTTQTHFWMICGPLWAAVLILTLALAFYDESVGYLRQVKRTILR